MVVMRVLALDQAAHTGYGVLDRDEATGFLTPLAFGTWDFEVRAKKGAPKKKRTSGISAVTLHNLFGSLALTIDRFRVDCLVVEDLYPGASMQTLIALVEIRGVAKLIAKIKNVPYFCYAPQVARANFGLSRGEEGKAQAAVYVQEKFKSIDLSGQPLDTTDALLLALYHLDCTVRADDDSGVDIFDVD